MNVLGRALVFLTVMVSLTGLGLAIWLFIDYRDWDKTVKDINQEIERRRFAKRLEEDALTQVMMEIRRGDRLMPTDVQSRLTQERPPAVSKTVQQAKAELEQLSEANKKLLDEATSLQVDYLAVVGQLARARDETMAALAEQRNLREQIKPENPDQKPLRDLTGDALAAMQAAQAGQERIRPDLVNERAKLFLLMERNAELKRRLAELGSE